MVDITIHIEGIRDSMGCYFGGTISSNGHVVGAASADDTDTLLGMLWELRHDKRLQCVFPILKGLVALSHR